MKKIFLFLVLAVIFGGGFLWFVFSGERARISQFEEPMREQKKPEGTRKMTLPPQINSEGEVTVTVTPLEFSVTPDGQIFEGFLDFEIDLDTHSVALDEDLIRVAELEGYIAEKWIGDPPGGHHRAGILSFLPKSPGVSLRSLRLTIRGLGGVPERNFVWIIGT